MLENSVPEESGKHLIHQLCCRAKQIYSICGSFETEANLVLLLAII